VGRAGGERDVVWLHPAVGFAGPGGVVHGAAQEVLDRRGAGASPIQGGQAKRQEPLARKLPTLRKRNRAGVLEPRHKSPCLPSPQGSVAVVGKLPEAIVPWYGQAKRSVRMFGACAAWYRCRGSGRGAVVPILWVYGRETLKGDEGYFYSTDPTLSGQQIITLFTARWFIEVTFQEVRAHLGFHTPRQRCRRSGLRTGPCLLGLFTVVSLIYAQIAKKKSVKIHQFPCYAKNEPTFVDALAAVRRVIWEQIILPRTQGAAIVAQIPTAIKDLLLDHLTAAA
jgi:hypothetical protein